MYETLMPEVLRIAKEINDKWIIREEPIERSVVIWTPTVRLLGFSGHQQEAVQNGLPEHLHELRLIQVGGQRRELFCVRLVDGFLWALLRLDSARIPDVGRRQLVQCSQLHLARILTEIVFGTGDGQQAAAGFRAVFNETTGGQLNLFPGLAPAPAQRRSRPSAFGKLTDHVLHLSQRMTNIPTEIGTIRNQLTEYAQYFVMLVESLRGKQPAPVDLRASLFRCYHDWPLGGRFDRFNGLEIIDAAGAAIPGAGTLHHITGGVATARNFMPMSLDFNSQLETDGDAAAQLDAVLPDWRQWERDWIAARPAERAIWERCDARARERHRSLRRWRGNMFRRHHRLFCTEPNGCPNCDDAATG